MFKALMLAGLLLMGGQARAQTYDNAPTAILLAPSASGAGYVPNTISASQVNGPTYDNAPTIIPLCGIAGTSPLKYAACPALGGGSGGVSSFNSRTGAVSPANGDYSPAMVGAVPAISSGIVYESSSTASRAATSADVQGVIGSGVYDASGAAANALNSAETFSANASNLSSGTVPVAQLPQAAGFALRFTNGSSYPKSGGGGYSLPASSTFYIVDTPDESQGTGLGYLMATGGVLRQVEFRLYVPNSYAAGNTSNASVCIYDETAGAVLTGTLTTSLSFTTTMQVVTLSGLLAPVISGHRLSMRIVTPNWTTAPTYLTITGDMFISPS